MTAKYLAPPLMELINETRGAICLYCTSGETEVLEV